MPSRSLAQGRYRLLSVGKVGRAWRGLWLGALLTTAACSADASGQATLGNPAGAGLAAGAAVDVTGPPAGAVVTSSVPAAPAGAAPGPARAAPVPVRPIVEQAWTPFASVNGVVLSHPSSRVERVGFHESNHDGARDLEPLPTAAGPVTLEGRDRGTSPRSAVDAVVDPATEIRAVVTGRVKRAGRYVLYCKYTDHYLVIAPDARPSWEVKMLHIGALRVTRGDRVLAGQTVVAPGPTQLPFESQVDELAVVAPAWPHVHMEVVDPSIPDRPNPGGGCT